MFLNKLFGGRVVATATVNPRMNDEPITTKTTERGALNVSNMTSYGFSGMQGWRVTMEDAHVISCPIPVQKTKALEGHALFGVMDGHGGGFTSLFASERFVETFSSQKELFEYSQLREKDKLDVPGVELLKAALSKTYEELDTEIRKQQNKMNDDLIALSEKKGEDCNIRFERSGSTCIVVLVTPKHIICANSGDSRAILRRGGQTLPLSFDHKPTDISESERITAAEGIVKNKRVDGDLAVSRGLGDFTYKSNESKTLAQQKVVPYPDFLVYPRDHENDEFMVLACDGIFDVSTNEQCSTFVQELLDEGETDIGLICEEAM
jgi:serine/threonine protein phosphatase PrpC